MTQTLSLHVLLQLSFYSYSVAIFKVTKSFINPWEILSTIGIEPEHSHSLGKVEVPKSHFDYFMVIVDSHQLVVLLYLKFLKQI